MSLLKRLGSLTATNRPPFGFSSLEKSIAPATGEKPRQKKSAPQKDSKKSFNPIYVGAIIVAVGYDVFDPSAIAEYRYREIPNVVTAIEFERLLSASGPTGGHLDRPSDLAVEAEIAELEKKAQKIEKTLNKYEEKYQ